MSHSRQTEHYGLPLYNGTDIINPLTDFNNANEAIDEAVYNANQRSVEAKEIAENSSATVEQFDARIISAQNTANEANTNASSAQATAEEAIASVDGFDARITTAQNTANEANTNANSAQATADEAIASVDGLDARVTTAQNTANTAQTTATEALAKASAVRNKKVLIIADSYGMRDENNNFCKLLTDKYPDIYDAVAMSGYGYTNGTFLTTLTDKLTTMSASEKEAITDVLFCGGWNDARELKAGRQTISSLVLAIKDTHDYANLNLPNAVCHAVFMAWQTYAHTQEGADYESLLNAMACYNSYGSGKNAPFESVQYVMRDSANFDETFFHPNALGNANLANAIHACVMGGDYHFSAKYEYHTKTSPFDGGVITGFTGGTMRYSIFDGITKINAINVAVSGSPTASMICQFKDSHCPCAFPDTPTNHAIYVPIIFNGTINGESVGYEPLYGILVNNKLNAYYKGGAITSIDGIMAFEVTIDNTQWV